MIDRFENFSNAIDTIMANLEVNGGLDKKHFLNEKGSKSPENSLRCYSYKERKEMFNTTQFSKNGVTQIFEASDLV